MSDLSEPASRRNIAALGVDYVTFGIGMAFLGPTTILPSLVRLLGGSPVVVGSLGTIQGACWLLPQLAAGRYVANRPLVKRYVVTLAATSRVCLALLVPALWWWSTRAPSLALGALLLAFAAFIVLDALSSVGWFDLVAKAIPIERRGRLMGAAQVLSSLGGIGVGMVVATVLARPDPLWANHVLLILLAALFFGLGPGALATMREPRGTVRDEARPGWNTYLPRLGSILRSDARFGWLIAARWLSGLADMAGAFYILFAADRLGMREQMIGLFVSAGVVGGLLSGLVLGPLGDRRGSAQVIRVMMGLRCLCPALALLAPFVAAYQPQLALGAFLVIFAAIGMANGAYMIGFMNYTLAIAPAGERSTYVALASTLGGLLTPAPLVAGWLVQATSYEWLFGLTLGLAGLGLALALREPGAAGVPQRAAALDA